MATSAPRRLPVHTPMTQFAVQNGADRAKFTEMYNSFGMQNKVRQGKQLSEAYKIDGVPALGIHGRYYTSPSLAGGASCTRMAGSWSCGLRTRGWG